MTSWIGKSIAHYRVTAQIGAGGMGEVYRASDSRLGRDVAIKVLPAEFAADAERMARFEREAKLLASLSRAGIASIFGIEEVQGARALVMELVEGPTLAERIAKGPLSPDEALPVAKQIAEALEYAHERGVIHRDLKPANIKITPDGAVKILDFGLAKALSDDPAGSSPDLSRSPTLTAASTRLGVILGTAAYMSPEQAKGKAVDRRADIWAFGAVLLEMLTGRQVFAGETVSETLASVMKDEPDWSMLPASTPQRVRDVIRRCLVKDPKQRLRDIGEARIRIEEVIAGKLEPSAPGAPAAAAPARRGLPVIVAVLIAAGAIALGVAAGYQLRRPAAPAMVRATLTFPDGMSLDEDDVPFALSPDGRTLAMAASARGEPQRLWLRRLDQADAVAVPGTDDAAYPFWSPDGRSIGFFAQRKLKRVRIDGGVVQTICDAVDGRGATWGPDGTIVFAPGPLDGLNRVSADGGTPEAVTTLDSLGASHRLPEFLPDGKRVLFACGGTSSQDNCSIECLDLASKKRTPIIKAQSQARYVAPDRIAYMAEGNVVVQRFDASSLAVSGGAMPVAQAVSSNPYRYAGAFDLNPAGTLVYVSRSVSESFQPTWFDLEGNELGKIGPGGTIVQASLAPAGDRLLTCDRNETFDLHMTDVASGVRTRFTFGPVAAFPLWSPDGKTVYYSDGTGTVFARASDGSTPARTIFTQAGVSMWTDQISPDGGSLVCCIQRPKTGVDIRIVPASGNGDVRDLITAPGNQGTSSFSPDGRWLAYQTDESGRDEVIAVRYPGLDGRWQLSSDGGTNPAWLSDGRGVLYTTADRHIARVDVNASGEGLVVGNTRRIFGGKPIDGPWLAARDGKRLMVLVPQGSGASVKLNLVTDWRQLPAAK